jgi:hypothetical protein
MPHRHQNRLWKKRSQLWKKRLLPNSLHRRNLPQKHLSPQPRLLHPV